MLPPLAFIENARAVPHSSIYDIYLNTAKEALSSHNTMKFVTDSSTFIDEPFLLTAYAANPSSTRDASDQRWVYVRRVTY